MLTEEGVGETNARVRSQRFTGLHRKKTLRWRVENGVSSIWERTGEREKGLRYGENFQ